MAQIDPAYKEDKTLRPLYWEFGEMLVRRGKKIPAEDRDAVTLLSAKCLQAVNNGHSCLDLNDWKKKEDSSEQSENISDYSPLTCEEWKTLLGIITELVSEDKKAFTPLYFDRDHNLLYLRKYCIAEDRIASAVLSRLDKKTGVPCDNVLKEQIHAVSGLYEKKPFDDDLQQQAVAMALTQHFSILTGGPGTGKTTTLAAFLVLALEKEPNLRIALAAPTGKAAVQMKDSLDNELREHIDVKKLSEKTLEKIKGLSCSTLHRLLRIGADGAKPFFNRNELLPYDLIVVDEVSMVSLKLLDQLFEALLDDCRVLLIGDQYQLASVEAGTVLGDFCSRCKLLIGNQADSPDKRHITRLWENHRADIESLKDFLHKMNVGADENNDLAAKLKPEIDSLYQRQDPKFSACELALPKDFGKQQEFLQGKLREQLDDMLKTISLPQKFKDYFGEEVAANITFGLAQWSELDAVPGEISADRKAQLPLALAHLYLNSVRVICAVHDGLFGERTINRIIGELLGKKGRANGAPILILRNDSETGLCNGDTGIFWNGSVYFPEWKNNDAGCQEFVCGRAVAPDRLPEYAPAYAMTIHKSQGSGYDNVLMILPDQDSRIVTRELIYTGISRTKKRFMLWGARHIFEFGINRPTVRWSGLPYLLDGESASNQC